MKAGTKYFIPLVLIVLLGIYLTSALGYSDLTADKRYTLSQAALRVLDRVDSTMEVRVYLKGEFPASFRKLAEETRRLLERFRDRNPDLHFEFINPAKEGIIDRLERQGMIPARITVRRNNRLEQIEIFPWAEIRYRGKTEHVPLMVSVPGAEVEEQVNRSIENLEYAFASAIYRLGLDQKPAIAVLKGHDEWDDAHIAGLLMLLRPYYRLAPFTLDSLKTNPQRTLEQLHQFDMVLIAGPRKAFSDTAKYALDQFILHGGKMLLAVDPVHAYKDTLMTRGKTYALNAELNLTDWLFAYGIRLNPVLVKDLVAAPVVLKTGEVAGNPQLEPFPWYYSPLAQPDTQHPIGKNVGKVKLDFASDIDTLKHNPLHKTVILHSSPYTQTVGVPVQINFSEIGTEPDRQSYNDGTKIFGILVEGKFRSAYADRTKPFDADHNENGLSKIAVFADGDILRNDLQKGRPLPLGFDKWSRTQYANGDFLLNTIFYLTDNNGLFALRNKEIHIPLLDKNKVVARGKFWAAVMLVFPVLLWLVAGLLYGWWRRKKYAR